MKFRIHVFALAVILFAVPAVYAQSSAAAIQQLQLSAFGGATGTYTGLSDGKNVGVTAGVDLGIRRFSWFLPSIEIRGSYPFYKGDTDAPMNAMGGLKVEKPYGKFHPYLDVLYGRSEIDYTAPGYPDPQNTYRYSKSPSNVLSLGGGLDFDITYHLSLKADAQMQQYSSPVAESGHLYAVPVTIGVVYRFDFTKYVSVAKSK